MDLSKSLLKSSQPRFLTASPPPILLSNANEKGLDLTPARAQWAPSVLCTWRWGGKSQPWPEPLKPREAMATKQMPPPLQTSPVRQLFKINTVRFSNPKRLLKPLLICLPFCFVCSAQVKGNLTFGILTANNLCQGQGLVCCSVSMWLTRRVGTFQTLQLSVEGPRRHTARGPRALSATPKAGLYLSHWLPRRSGPAR